MGRRTRTPFITRWKGKIQPAVSDEIVSTVDFTASFAKLTGQSLASEGALDSLNVLGALLGQSGSKGREAILQQDNGSGNYGLRVGDWKLVRIEKRVKTQARVSKDDRPLPSTKHTLYKLSDDPGEQTDVAAQNPEVVQRLVNQLEEMIQNGRTRPLNP